MNKKTVNSVRVLLFLYILFVLALCFARFSDSEELRKFIMGIPTDKIVHFTMFLPFPFLAFWSFFHSTKRPFGSLTAVIFVFIVGCGLAGLTEYGQSFTSYRTCDPLDFRADCTALAIASVIVLVIDLTKAFRRK